MKPPTLSQLTPAQKTAFKAFQNKLLADAKRADVGAPALFWYCRTPQGWRYFPADRKGVSVYPGRYVIRENVDGKRGYTNVDGDPRAALQAARTRARQRSRSHNVTQAPRTLTDDIERYIANRIEKRKHEAAENARVVLPEFASVVGVQSTKNITVAHLDAYCAAMHARGLSDRTVSNRYERVRSFLKFAGHNVALSSDDRPKFETKLPTVYTKVETDALLDHADEYMRVAIILGLRLGLREQEIAAAEWSDIDREHRTFRVQSKPHRNFVVKDKEERDVPIPLDVLDVLTRWQAQRQTTLIVGVGVKHDRVNGHLLRQLKAVANRARIGKDEKFLAEATLHKLRRTYVTTMLRSQKLDLRTIQAFVGHSDIESTMRYMRPAAARETLAQVDAIEF